MGEWRLLLWPGSADRRWRLRPPATFLLLLLLLLCLQLDYSLCQPFSGITSYPIPQSAVPVPGALSKADAPQPPDAVTAASVGASGGSSNSSSAASTTTSSSSSSSASTSSTTVTAVSSSVCSSNWCTQAGQWLPTNINYLLLAAALLLLLAVLRSDRALCAVLLCWAASLFVFFLVDQFVLWYLLLTVDFAVYAAVYSGAGKKDGDDDSEEEEDEEEEGGAEGGEQAVTDRDDRWLEEHLRGAQARQKASGSARRHLSSARGQQSARLKGGNAAAAAFM